MSILATYKQQWDDMDPPFKIIMVIIPICGAVYMAFNTHDSDQQEKVVQAKPQTVSSDSSLPTPYNSSNIGVLPTNTRNQGLEDLTIEIQAMRNELEILKNAPKPRTEDVVTPTKNPGYSPSGMSPSNPASQELDTPLPPPVSFDDTKPTKKSTSIDSKVTPTTDAFNIDSPIAPVAPVETDEIVAVSHKSDESIAVIAKEPPPITIPANSALESVMLSGINARPSGSSAAGRITTAVDVGTPFVTKLKGDALLPNGWKSSRLGDCFLSGSGIAILSAERVNVVSDKISCISSDGKIFEGNIKAYGLDVDGIQGIAGHVVSKQGTILMQSALAGVASGLGQAMTPTTIPAYNSNSTGGTVQAQYPSPSIVAQTAVGQGVSQGANQLSKFYLDYARETFPVIEVNSGTRVTWVLKDSVELRMTKKVTK